MSNNRMVIFGKPEGSNETAVRIAYEAANGEMRVWIPQGAVVSRIICADGERTAYVLSETQIGDNTFDPAQVFVGEYTPMAPVKSNDVEFVDAVEQGVEEANLRYLVNEQKGQNAEKLSKVSEAVAESIDIPMPAIVEIPMPTLVEDIDDAPVAELSIDEEAIATGFVGQDTGAVQETVDLDSDDYDDSVPQFAQASPEPANTNTAWGGALLKGERYRHAVPWQFTPTKVPAYVMTQADAESAPVPVPVNKANGSPAAYHIMNPTLANENQPAGAHLGTVSEAYHLLPHTTVFDPIMKYGDQKGLKTHVTSYNQGAKARLDIDVSQATQSRQLAAQRLKEKGHKWLDTSTFNDSVDKLDGLYKYGFAIHNSVDGSGSLSVQGQALRVYCNNLAVMGGVDTIVRLRHRNGVMNSIDWDAFGETIVNATVELQEWLVNQELLSYIPIDAQLFNKLTVAGSKINALTLPRVKVEDEKTGKFSLQGAHMWRVIGSGYVNPNTGGSGRDLPFVKVDQQQNGTAYHALQCFTGAITHKPEWVSADGKSKMAGNTLTIDSMTKKLTAVNSMFTGLGESVYSAYLEHTGQEKLSQSDLPLVAEFVKQNPDVIEVAIGGRRTALSDVPTVEESLMIA